jgi:hypothetical protein
MILPLLRDFRRLHAHFDGHHRFRTNRFTQTIDFIEENSPEFRRGATQIPFGGTLGAIGSHAISFDTGFVDSAERPRLRPNALPMPFATT